MGQGLVRVFAVPAARQAALAALLASGIGMAVGAIRLLPFALAPGGEVFAPLVLAALAASLEVALVVGPAVGFALAAARLEERGELRALASLGLSPFRIALGAAPVLALAGVLAGSASAAWGAQAASPGRLASGVAERARRACESHAATAPGFVDVPLLGASWICFPGVGGEPGRALLVGALPEDAEGSGAPPSPPPSPPALVFAASRVAPSADLRTLVLHDAELLHRASGPAADRATLRAGTLTLRGLPPLVRPSNLRPAERALLLGVSSALLAAASAISTLRARLRGTARALALGAAGPAAALLALSHLERAPAPLAAYLALPAAGLAAILVAARLVARPSS